MNINMIVVMLICYVVLMFMGMVGCYRLARNADKNERKQRELARFWQQRHMQTVLEIRSLQWENEDFRQQLRMQRRNAHSLQVVTK